MTILPLPSSFCFLFFSPLPSFLLKFIINSYELRYLRSIYVRDRIDELHNFYEESFSKFCMYKKSIFTTAPNNICFENPLSSKIHN
ncbi:hypothetical protein RchiOBHm_Chr1g0345501 [Rosa chinensis]|uniref:Uncharacterized protein n=1 Tax=Rosa chinensis TaxID=74649 RepID=A0A2P6SET2_ROSCH|nr:hypothetical protein RchiOBHm_Chr1g0345501 [Rosa chinensis]